MAETDTVMVIRDGRLVNGNLRVVYVLTVLSDERTIEGTAKRCQCSEQDVLAVLSFASACVARCTT
jgi:hypothetical protein